MVKRAALLALWALLVVARGAGPEVMIEGQVKDIARDGTG